MSKDWVGNTNSVYKIIAATNHSDAEREQRDFYATDPIAIDKLVSVELKNMSHHIYEPSEGNGHLSNRLKYFFFDVCSADIIQRDYPLDYICDFLESNREVEKYVRLFSADILTNPPYNKAKEFVLKALDVVREGCNVYMFLKLTFLEGKARYKELFSKYPPRCVYVFSERVMCAKNGEFDKVKEGGGSAVAYAWFCWTKGYKGDTVVKWI